MLIRVLRVITGRHWTSEAVVLNSVSNQQGSQGYYTSRSTQLWRRSVYVHKATLTSMADASYSLTPDELKSFLLTGVLREKWTNKTLLLATVKDKLGAVIHHNKYTYTSDRQLHAEEQLLQDLRRDPETEGEDAKLIDRAKEIQLLSNYSPCDHCARKLIQLKCLKITIKCAHLYNVWPQQNRRLAWANIQGLRAMDRASIRIQAFTNDDWLQLLLDSGISGSSLAEVLKNCVYDVDRVRQIVWGRNKADETTREVLDIIIHHNAGITDVRNVYKRALDAADKELQQDKRGPKR